MAGKTLTTPEVAERLGVSRQTVHRYLTMGKIPSTRTPGGEFRVEESVLNLFMRRADGTNAKVDGPRIIALANQKGGVGKTTTAVNLASELANLGETVLIVDADPQANATLHMGLVPYELDVTLYDVMLHSERGADFAIRSIRPGLDLLPSKIDLSAVEWELAGFYGRERILKKALAPVLQRYSFILVDCPPALGLLTLNALAVATEVIIPLQVEPFAVHGLAQLQNTIRVVQGDNPNLHISGVVCTMYDSRNSLSPAIAGQIRQEFGELVFNASIPRNVALSMASGAGRPVSQHDPNSSGADAYRALAEEVLTRGED